MKNPTWLYTGDANMLDYGGRFYRKLAGTRRWHFVDVCNMDDACGRDNEGCAKYCVDLSEVDLDSIPEKTIASAMQSCGYDEDPAVSRLDPDARECMIAEACHGYGAKAPLWQDSGNNRHALIREAKRESRLLQKDVDAMADRMEAPVNAIGSTAREFMQGDLASPILRGLEAGDPRADLMARMGMLRK